MTTHPLFPLGDVLVTRRILEEKSAPYILSLLKQHEEGKWGDTHLLEGLDNDYALLNGEQIVSRYGDDPWMEVVVITTEADRSQTVVSLSDEV